MERSIRCVDMKTRIVRPLFPEYLHHFAFMKTKSLSNIGYDCLRILDHATKDWDFFLFYIDCAETFYNISKWVSDLPSFLNSSRLMFVHDPSRLISGKLGIMNFDSSLAVVGTEFEMLYLDCERSHVHSRLEFIYSLCKNYEINRLQSLWVRKELSNRSKMLEQQKITSLYNPPNFIFNTESFNHKSIEDKQDSFLLKKKRMNQLHSKRNVFWKTIPSDKRQNKEDDAV